MPTWTSAHTPSANIAGNQTYWVSYSNSLPPLPSFELVVNLPPAPVTGRGRPSIWICWDGSPQRCIWLTLGKEASRKALLGKARLWDSIRCQCGWNEGSSGGSPESQHSHPLQFDKVCNSDQPRTLFATYHRERKPVRQQKRRNRVPDSITLVVQGVQSVEGPKCGGGKATLMKWRPASWIEHATFGIGQVSEIREDKLDIDFLNHGRRTILKSTELKASAAPSPAFKFTRGKRQPR